MASGPDNRELYSYLELPIGATATTKGYSGGIQSASSVGLEFAGHRRRCVDN